MKWKEIRKTKQKNYFVKELKSKKTLFISSSSTARHGFLFVLFSFHSIKIMLLFILFHSNCNQMKERNRSMFLFVFFFFFILNLLFSLSYFLHIFLFGFFHLIFTIISLYFGILIRNTPFLTSWHFIQLMVYFTSFPFRHRSFMIRLMVIFWVLSVPFTLMTRKRMRWTILILILNE